MEKTDRSKADSRAFTASRKPEMVFLSASNYVSVRGKGDPSGPGFASHVGALYAVAYTLKFQYKSQNQDFVVSKLEGQWWYDSEIYKNVTMEDSPTKIPRGEWFYRLLIRIPDFVDPADLSPAVQSVLAKKGIQTAEMVEWFSLPARHCVQMLHEGPFENEPETLSQMLAFMNTQKLEQAGAHHEIYLSDFRKTPSEKLKTILREPVSSI